MGKSEQPVKFFSGLMKLGEKEAQEDHNRAIDSGWLFWKAGANDPFLMDIRTGTFFLDRSPRARVQRLTYLSWRGPRTDLAFLGRPRGSAGPDETLTGLRHVDYHIALHVPRVVPP